MSIDEIADHVRREFAARPPKPLTAEQVHKLRVLFKV